jgi:hypothetical protein
MKLSRMRAGEAASFLTSIALMAMGWAARARDSSVPGASTEKLESSGEGGRESGIKLCGVPMSAAMERLIGIPIDRDEELSAFLDVDGVCPRVFVLRRAAGGATRGLGIGDDRRGSESMMRISSSGRTPPDLAVEAWERRSAAGLGPFGPGARPDRGGSGCASRLNSEVSAQIARKVSGTRNW